MDMDELSKRFLCCFPVREIRFENVLNNITWEEQEVLLKNTTSHPILVNKPINIAYQVSFLKKVLDYLNNEHIEIHDDVYSTYCTLIQQEKENKDYYYKHYKFSNDNSCFITLKENLNLISNGTTGLRTWEASIVLSEWCIQNFKKLYNKAILELGSGAGLTGIIAFEVCKPKSLWMSDCHELVLNLLKENVLLNYDEKELSISCENTRLELKKESNTLGILKLSWEDVEKFSTAKIPYPDILIAADIIYDSSIFDCLLKTFSYFLKINEQCEIFLACTIRNRDTLDSFINLLDKNIFNITILPQLTPLHMCWLSTSNVVLYKITHR